jgi:hypothetical protein
VLSAAGTSVVSFPVGRITACSEQSLKVQWGTPNVLRLQLDNGGREYVVVHPSPARPVGTWAATLTQAQATAPELAYDRVPTLSPGFEQPSGRGAQRLLLYWALGVAALCVVCAVAALAVNGLGG